MQNTLMRLAFRSLAVIVVVLSFTGIASAAVAAPVPEIDGSMVTTGLGLLAAGVLVLRSRRRG